MRTERLPLSVRDWPVQPGADMSAPDTLRAYRVRQHEWCDDRRHNWHCTRERNHALPHVAVGNYVVVAVWDQQWFGDDNFVKPIPIADVPRLRTVNRARYDELP